MAAMTIADLDAAIKNLTTLIQPLVASATGYIADVTTAFNALQQKIATLQAQVGTSVDTTTEVTAINTAIQNLTAIVQPLASADAAAKVEAQ